MVYNSIFSSPVLPSTIIKEGRKLPGPVYSRKFVSVDMEDFPEKSTLSFGHYPNEAGRVLFSGRAS